MTQKCSIIVIDFLKINLLGCEGLYSCPPLQVNNDSLYSNVCNSNTLLENVSVKRQNFWRETKSFICLGHWKANTAVSYLV